MSLQRLDEIMDLSRRMLASAEAGEWERVQWLEARRQALIDDCFPLRSPVPDPQQARQRLERILQLDRQVVALAESLRNQAAEGLKRLQKGRQATRAYQQS